MTTTDPQPTESSAPAPGGRPTSVPRFDASAAVEEVVAALRSHGVVIVESLAPADVCDRIAAELAPHVSATPHGADGFTGHETTRTGALLARSRSVCELVAHPFVLDVVDAVLWPSKTTFQLFGASPLKASVLYIRMFGPQR